VSRNCVPGRNIEETIFSDLSSFEGEIIEYELSILDIAESTFRKI
jgi:hypothetical protein